jgi:hypothetical protein
VVGDADRLLDEGPEGVALDLGLHLFVALGMRGGGVPRRWRDTRRPRSGPRCRAFGRGRRRPSNGYRGGRRRPRGCT